MWPIVRYLLGTIGSLDNTPINIVVVRLLLLLADRNHERVARERLLLREQQQPMRHHNNCVPELRDRSVEIPPQCRQRHHYVQFCSGHADRQLSGNTEHGLSGWERVRDLHGRLCHATAGSDAWPIGIPVNDYESHDDAAAELAMRLMRRLLRKSKHPPPPRFSHSIHAGRNSGDHHLHVRDGERD